MQGVLQAAFFHAQSLTPTTVPAQFAAGTNPRASTACDRRQAQPPTACLATAAAAAASLPLPPNSEGPSPLG